MRHVKIDCKCAPPCCDEPQPCAHPRDWEAHPSWIAGMEALSSYGNWVSAVVMPIAFQWIEEHKAEVYASVPSEFRDDVGVVIAAAFNLVRELPAYKAGRAESAAYEKALADGTWDPTKTNPVWTGVVKKVRAETKGAFAEKSALLGDCPK
jgi:hypothetical protein